MNEEKKKIPVNQLTMGMTIAENVNVFHGGANMMVVRKHTFVDDKIISQLRRYKIRQVEIFAAHEQGTIIKKAKPKPAPVTPTAPPKITQPILGDDLRSEAIDSIREIFTAFQTKGADVNHANAFQTVSRFEQMLSYLLPAITVDISGLIQMQDKKSYRDYPYNHSLSVAVLAVATSQVLGFSMWEQLRLARCATLHDVGKPYVPTSISEKKGVLTSDEFAIMKEHAINGATNLKSKGFGDLELWNGVMFHHEKYDGSGYPKGLKGDDIPIFSQLISIADMYDALTSYRPHREAMPPATAFELISAEAGKSFSYDIVRAFYELGDIYAKQEEKPCLRKI